MVLKTTSNIDQINASLQNRVPHTNARVYAVFGTVGLVVKYKLRVLVI